MFVGKAHKTKDNHCPSCNILLDGASQLNGDNMPNPGDVGVCVYCSNVHVFDDDLSMRKPTPEEESEILKNPHIIKIQKSIFEANCYLHDGHLFGYNNS